MDDIRNVSSRCKLDGCHHHAFIDASAELDEIAAALGMQDTDDSMAEEIRKHLSEIAALRSRVASLSRWVEKARKITDGFGFEPPPEG